MQEIYAAIHRMGSRSELQCRIRNCKLTSPKRERFNFQKETFYGLANIRLLYKNQSFIEWKFWKKYLFFSYYKLYYFSFQNYIFFFYSLPVIEVVWVCCILVVYNARFQNYLSLFLLYSAQNVELTVSLNNLKKNKIYLPFPFKGIMQRVYAVKSGWHIIFSTNKYITSLRMELKFLQLLSFCAAFMYFCPNIETKA